MTLSPLLDTHVWIWWMLGDPGLSRNERDALDALPPDARPVISDISLWEFATLMDLGRIRIDGSVGDSCISGHRANPANYVRHCRGDEPATRQLSS